VNQVIKTVTVTESPANKLATTNITNPIVRALADLRQSPNLPAPIRRAGWTDVRAFWGVVVDKGPQKTGDGATNSDGSPAYEEDYPDERYWVRPAFIDPKDAITTDPADPTTYITTSFPDDDPDDPNPQGIIVATNRAELMLDKETGNLDEREPGTHLVPVGKHVLVFESIDTGVSADGEQAGTEPNSRFHFYHAVQYRFEIIGNADKPGVYKFNFEVERKDAFDPTGSDPLATEDFGDAPGPDTGPDDPGPDDFDGYAVNRQELGLNTHGITAGGGDGIMRFSGDLRARQSTDGYFVVDFNGMDDKDCSS
jgi:hypothetical protein